VGTVSIPHEVKLPAKQKTTMSVPLSIAWSDLGNVASLVLSNRDVPYTVDGTVTLGGDLLDVKVPFRITGTVTHEQLARAAQKSLPNIPGLAPVIY
jgi:hypothetical protein